MRKCLYCLWLCFAVTPLFSQIEWSTPPVTISTSNVNASHPEIAIDGSGNLVAVWIENNFVKASSMPVGGSFGSIATLSNSGASSPQVVMDPNGNATAIWAENGAVKAATLPLNGSWSSSTTLAALGASSPQIAVGSTGNLVAVWVSGGSIQTSKKAFGGSWSVLATTISGANSDSPQVAMGDNGNIVVVWHSLVSGTHRIFSANKLFSGLVWSSALAVSTPTQNSINPDIAVDSNGNAVAIWFRFNVSGVAYSSVVAQASSQPMSGSWTTPVDLSVPGLYNPSRLVASVAYDGNGNAIALWTNSTDGSTFEAEASIMPNGQQTWQSRSDFVTDLHVYAVEAAVTSAGDVFSLFMGSGPSNSLIIQGTDSHTSFRLGLWSAPVTVSQGTSNGYPRVAAVLSGVTNIAGAVWLNFDGTNTIIQATTGTGTIFTAPSNLSVTQSSTDYGVVVEYDNTLSWVDSDPNVQGYLIYRDGVFITQLSPDMTQFLDQNRGQNESVTYGVAAFDAQNNKSSTTTISFP